MKPGEASAKGSLVMIEHTDDISVVAITGLVDKLYIEQVWETLFVLSSLYSVISVLVPLSLYVCLSVSFSILFTQSSLSFVTAITQSLFLYRSVLSLEERSFSQRTSACYSPHPQKGVVRSFCALLRSLSFSQSLSISLILSVCLLRILLFFMLSLSLQFLSPCIERGVVCFTPTKFRSSRFLEFTSKPSTDLPLTHHVFRFDYPVEQPGGEKIFSRGCKKRTRRG